MEAFPVTGVSVIVATARADEMLYSCAAAVAKAAARVREPVELIVVDDRELSADERRPQDEMLQGLMIRRIWSRDSGVSGQADARNLGAAAARYDILALTDDDARPDPSWLDFGVARLRSDPRLAGVEGAIRLDRNEPVDAVRSRLVVNERGGARINASMFYRAEAYRAVGGSRLMWLRPPVNYREDTDLATRIEREVGPIAFEPRSFVVHPPEPVDLHRLVWLGRCYKADAMLARLHPGVFPALHKRPLARLRIRLATALALLHPGLLWPRTRRASALLILAIGGAVSVQFELEIRSAGIRRGPVAIVRDTIRRLPRALLWSAVAGSSRLQGEVMVRLGLIDVPRRPPGPCRPQR